MSQSYLQVDVFPIRVFDFLLDMFGHIVNKLSEQLSE